MEDKKFYKKRIESLINDEKKKTASSGAQDVYSANHQERFNYILNLSSHLKPDDNISVLDIGRSELTYHLSQRYKDVTSLGLPLELDDGGHREVSDIQHLEHINFDLNKSGNVDLWQERYAHKFDLIIISETIEHLHVAPEFCLLFLHYLLNKQGNIILTTPNAASIHKRIRLLFGVHPYEKIRYYDANPGHFREYTVREMEAIGRAANLRAIEKRLINYRSLNVFESLSAFKYVLLKPFENIPGFRDYMIVVFEASGY